MRNVQLASGLPQADAEAAPMLRKRRSGVDLADHATGTVTPVTFGRKEELREGSGNDSYRAGRFGFVLPPPPEEFLVCAYLGEQFRKRAETPPDNVSYERQARELGTTKQNILKLKNGGTVGTQVLFVIAKSLFGGLFDPMVDAAKVWWAYLPEEEQVKLSQWSDGLASRRPLTEPSPDRKLAEESASKAKSDRADGADAGTSGRRGRAAVGRPSKRS